jgi:hypothetical protein
VTALILKESLSPLASYTGISREQPGNDSAALAHELASINASSDRRKVGILLLLFLDAA